MVVLTIAIIIANILAIKERSFGMAALTMGLAEAKNNFSRVTAEVNRTGRPVTILKNNKPWVIIQPAQGNTADAVDVAIDFMDEYADVFKELSK
jgi:antitoxin Phd